MTFYSFSFLEFILVLLLLYYVTPGRHRWKLLLAASYIFYMTWEWKLVLLLLACTLWTYFTGMQIQAADSRKAAKFWLLSGILPVLGLLFLYKYLNFFLEASAKFLTVFHLPAESKMTAILAPVGISFYTFKMISYLAEIYKDNIKAESNFFLYALYISFFPQIIAGPIERPDSLLPQFRNLQYNPVLFYQGFELIVIGFFKKLVIANRLSNYVDTIFQNPRDYNGTAGFLAALLFSILIYCDFSGYSDIAIGIGNLFGITCIRNFDKPYLSKNIRDFWRRWHISLSSWLRDYVFIPLGGSRKGTAVTLRNIGITFILSGLWHGADWTFLLWGGIHALYQQASLLAGGILHKLNEKIQIVITYILVTAAWIFFKANTIDTALYMVKNIIFNFSLRIEAIQAAVLPFTGDNTCLAYLLTVLLFAFFIFAKEWNEKYKPHKKAAFHMAWTVFFLVTIFLFGNFGGSSFLYAQF